MEVFKRALLESKDKSKYELEYKDPLLENFDDDEYDFAILDA
jgi:hypothetical protein